MSYTIQNSKTKYVQWTLFFFRDPENRHVLTSTLYIYILWHITWEGNILLLIISYYIVKVRSRYTLDNALKCFVLPVMVVVVMGKKRRWPYVMYTAVNVNNNGIIIIILQCMCVGTVFSSAVHYMQFVTSNVVARGGMGSVTSTLVHFSRSEYFWNGNNQKCYRLLLIPSDFDQCITS